MASTPPLSIFLFLVAALLGAAGQFLYKSGADAATGGVMSYLLNGRLLGGVACYVGVMVLFVAAFKRGGALTVLYPVYASTFIWAALIAWGAYGIPVRPIHVAGWCLLVVGMYLTGWPTSAAASDSPEQVRESATELREGTRHAE